MKISNKNRIIALLTAMIFVISSFTGVLTVFGIDEESNTNLEESSLTSEYSEEISEEDIYTVNGISILNSEDSVGSIIDNVLYVKYGKTINLDFNTCINYFNMDSILVQVKSGNKVISYKAENGKVELPTIDGKYTLKVLFKDGVEKEYQLGEEGQISGYSFKEIVYDKKEYIVKRITFCNNVNKDEVIPVYDNGETGNWVVYTGDKISIHVITNLDISECTYSIEINSKKVSKIISRPEYSNRLMIVAYNDYKDYIENGSNTISVHIKNKYGSVFDYSYNFYYDNSDLSISKAVLVNENDKIVTEGSKVYVNKGTNVKVDIANTGTEGEEINSVQVIANYTKENEYTIQGIKIEDYDEKDNVITAVIPLSVEGDYTIFVTTNTGRKLVKNIFGDDSYEVNFDIESPNIFNIKYNGRDILEDTWYNNIGTLSFSVKDNISISNNVRVELLSESGDILKILYTMTSNPVVTSSYGNILECNYGLDMNYVVDDKSNGIYYLNIVSEDSLGNKSEHYFMIKIDVTNPTYLDGENKLLKVENVTLDGDNYFISDKIIISGNFKDYQSGIKSIEYRENKDSDYFEISLPYTVDEIGWIKVTDNANNSQEYLVSDLLSLLIDGKYIVDNDVPVITMKGIKPSYEKDGLPYYSYFPTWEYTITDKNMKSVSFYVNGILQEDNIYHSDDIYNFYPKGVSDGKININVVAVDKSNHISENKFSFVVDTSAPNNIKVTSVNPVNQKNGKVYFNNPFDINITADDITSGINKYYMNNEISTNGVFKINDDGNYTIAVEDNLGNKTSSIVLSQYLNWQGNNIIIDTNKPNIITKRPSGESDKKSGWFGNDVEYNISISDDKGIDNAYVTINGVKVDSYYTDKTDIKNISLTANTSKVKPNEDGSYNVVIYVEDNAKLSDTWSDTIFIDKTFPKVNNFIISGDVSRNGNQIGGSNSKYGFFFNGNGSIQINTEDSGISSGIDSIWYKFDNEEWKGISTKGDAILYVDIPENYKGSFQAYVIDNVGHKSSIEMPDNLVSETSNTHINRSKINISFDTSNHYDSNNIPLYNKDVKVKAYVECDWSGLKYLEWGIDDKTYGNITDFTNAGAWDKNLPLNFSTSMLIGNNENGIKLWVKVIDNIGHISENYRTFSIDKDVPVINVSYDNTIANGYYNKNRKATITVKERNFDSSLIAINGVSGELGAWSNSGDIWSNTIVFSDEKDYDFSIICTDKAGNKSNTYTSGKFTIDKTKPVISVSWDNDNFKNGKYYKNLRVATISVYERNFDSSLIKINGASFGEWVNNGDVHTNTITFNDGIHSFSLSGSDMVGNLSSEGYNSGQFIVDTKNPDISISGITEGVSYKNEVSIYAVIKDDYYNKDYTTAVLKGKNHKDISIEGVYDEKTCTFKFDNFPKTDDIDDIYTLIIKSEDMSGNISEKSISFSVNRFGSKYSFYNQDVIGNYLNKISDITITETNTDKLDTSKVKVIVTLNSKDVTISDKIINVKEYEKNGKYMYDYTIDKSLFNNDGKYTIQIYSTSDDGTKYTSVAEQYDFVIDTTKPEIVVSGISNGESYQGYSKLVTVDVRDLSEIKDLSIYLNGNKVSSELKDNLYTFTVYESKDVQNIKFVATDKAGNISELEIKDFIISSDVGVYLWNQLWFRILLGIVALIIILLVIILIKHHKDAVKAEKQRAIESQKIYKSHTTSNNIDEDKTNILRNGDDNDKTNFLK